LVGKGVETAVVDQFAPKVRDPRVKVFVQDLDSPPKFDTRPYDTLLMLDVIEHIKDPESFLEQVRAQFTSQPKKVILTTPNIAFVVQRLMLLAGQFNYGKAGILDRTHTRLFTFRTLEHLLRDQGFRIKEVRGVPAPFPKVLGDNFLGRAAVAANLAAIRLSKTLFSYQIYVEAETTPAVEHVLREAKEKSAERAAVLDEAVKAGKVRKLK
jgi:hypothetical protein